MLSGCSDSLILVCAAYFQKASLTRKKFENLSDTNTAEVVRPICRTYHLSGELDALLVHLHSLPDNLADGLLALPAERLGAHLRRFERRPLAVVLIEHPDLHRPATVLSRRVSDTERPRSADTPTLLHELLMSGDADLLDCDVTLLMLVHDALPLI
jgi:hypothetical protein